MTVWLSVGGVKQPVSLTHAQGEMIYIFTALNIGIQKICKKLGQCSSCRNPERKTRKVRVTKCKFGRDVQ